MITFEEQEVPNSPFFITVDPPAAKEIVNDDVDSPGNELTRKCLEIFETLDISGSFSAADDDQPVYENLIERETIIYERQETEEIQITNLDEHDDEIILHEDHIYYAHVRHRLFISMIEILF